MRELLEAAERTLLQALLERDHAVVAAILDDDFLITTAGWITEPVDQATWLSSLADHELDNFTMEVVAVRLRDPVAVVLAESRQEGRRSGAPWQHTFRYTDVWSMQDGKPRLLVRHASVIRPPPAGQGEE
jgi:hypothetical protein